LAVFAALGATGANLVGRVALATGERADFDTFVADARASFVPFFAVRLVVLADRPAVFAECVLILQI
jgi:hypothetical protein